MYDRGGLANQDINETLGGSVKDWVATQLVSSKFCVGHDPQNRQRN